MPKYGALGTYGVRGPGPGIVDLDMLPADGSYGFAAGKVYNLNSSQYICEMQSRSSAPTAIWPIPKWPTPCGRR